jgi:phage shock protein B
VEDVMEILLVMGILFIGLPWIIFHYITKWKTLGSLTAEDENLLDELHDLARRLDERVVTVERIMTAENPNWRSIGSDTSGIGIEDQSIRSIRR